MRDLHTLYIHVTSPVVISPTQFEKRRKGREMSKTPEERKARQREYSRAYRQRRRHEIAAVLAPPASRTPGPMLKSLTTALQAMKWLADSDAALVALAKMQAAGLDALGDLKSPAAFGLQLRYHAALHRSLQELGGTPRVRTQQELRSARLTRGAESAQVDASPNVTRLARPPKRSKK